MLMLQHPPQKISLTSPSVEELFICEVFWFLIPVLWLGSYLPAWRSVGYTHQEALWWSVGVFWCYELRSHFLCQRALQDTTPVFTLALLPASGSHSHPGVASHRRIHPSSWKSGSPLYCGISHQCPGLRQKHLSAFQTCWPSSQHCISQGLGEGSVISPWGRS